MEQVGKNAGLSAQSLEHFVNKLKAAGPSTPLEISGISTLPDAGDSCYIVESLRIAFAALRANPARGILTTLGIIIGIVAVSTTMTAANGLADNFRESVSVLGTDVLYVSRVPWIFDGRFFRRSTSCQDHTQSNQDG